MALQAIADYLRPKSLCLHLLVLVALALAMAAYALPSRSMVRVETHDDKIFLPFLPDIEPAKANKTMLYTYSLDLYYTNTQREQTLYEITPSICVDSIRVNGAMVPFKKLGRCDARPGRYWNVYAAPIYIDLARYVKNGRNTIEIQSRRAEFNIGPVILSGKGHLSLWLGYAMVLVTCLALVQLMQRLTADTGSGLLLASGFMVYLNRLSHLGINQYSMDLPGHIEYITHIANRWDIPAPYTGYLYYHFPFYYFFGAIFVHFIELFRAFDVYTCLQLFSLGCFLTFIVFSLLTLRRLISEPLAYYAVALLLVFYPSGILVSSRIDSDLLFYAGYSACLYFTTGWLTRTTDKEFARNFALTLLTLGIAIATRKNAVILFPLLFLAVLYRKIRWGWPSGLLKNPIILASSLVLAIALTVSLGRAGYYTLTNVNHLVSHQLSEYLHLHALTLKTLLVPNIPLYFRHPIWSVWVDSGGRQFFWNSMLKSSLFGEFKWANTHLAFYLDYLLVAIIIYIVDGYLVHYRFLRQYPQWWMCLLSMAAAIAALMVFRVMLVYACAEDFRYIYPCVTSLCGLFGLVLERHIRQWRPFRKAIGIVICVAFAFCSVKFYLIY